MEKWGPVLRKVKDSLKIYIYLYIKNNKSRKIFSSSLSNKESDNSQSPAERMCMHTNSEEGVKASWVTTQLRQVVNKAVAFLIGEEVH